MKKACYCMKSNSPIVKKAIKNTNDGFIKRQVEYELTLIRIKIK
jgi:hypothetical protein